MNTSTTRSITYNGDRIEYELTIKRVKNMNMRITRDGVIHVSANGYVPDYRVDKFVIENMPFIERARYKIDALNAKRVDALQYVNGESLSILGIPVTLRLASLVLALMGRRFLPWWYLVVRPLKRSIN